MKKDKKDFYQEFFDNINFPIIVYIYETGRIICINNEAAKIIGDDIKNINSMWDYGIRRKLDRNHLNNGSRIFNKERINAKNKKIYVDIEINSILLEKSQSHIILCIFDETYKQIFGIKYLNTSPRVYWKNNALDIFGYNKCFKIDYNINNNNIINYKTILKNTVNTVLLEEDKKIIQTQKYRLKDYHKIIYNKKEYFLNISRIPVFDKKDKVIGIIGIYFNIINKYDYEVIMKNTIKENTILTDIISKSDIIVFRIKADENGTIMYVSPNVTILGYNVEEFLINKVSYKDLICIQEFERIKNEIKYFDENYIDIFVQEYKVKNKKGSILWVNVKTQTYREDKNIIYREILLRDITMQKNLEEKIKLNKSSFLAKYEKVMERENVDNLEEIELFDIIDRNDLRKMIELFKNITNTDNFITDNKNRIFNDYIDIFSENAIEYCNNQDILIFLKNLTKEAIRQNKGIISKFLTISYIGVIPFILGDRHIATWYIVIDNNNNFNLEYFNSLVYYLSFNIFGICKNFKNFMILLRENQLLRNKRDYLVERYDVAKLLISQSDLINFIISKDGHRIIYVNNLAKQMFGAGNIGLSFDKFIEKHNLEFYKVEDGINTIYNIYNTYDTIIYEEKYKTFYPKENKWFGFKVKVSNLNNGGQVYFITLYDITEYI